MASQELSSVLCLFPWRQKWLVSHCHDNPNNVLNVPPSPVPPQLKRALSPCRCLPSTVSELQAEAKHRVLHPADLHALHPHHHPVLGVVLDKLRRLGRQSRIRYDVSRAVARPQRCRLTVSHLTGGFTHTDATRLTLMSSEETRNALQIQ